MAMSSLTYARHAHPGSPIELIRLSDGVVTEWTITDLEALRLVAKLSEAVASNQKLDLPIRAEGEGGVVSQEGMGD